MVKAFDRVPRELLWIVLERFGVPAKLIRLIRVLHDSFRVKFDIDGVSCILDCIIGVKQGDILGPLLFVFFIAAIMITWKLTCDIPACVFRTRDDFMLTGRKPHCNGEDFDLFDSEYADDTAVIFFNRENTLLGVISLITHFNKFGMEIHTGVSDPRGPSKTVILFLPKPSHLYDNPDTFDDADLSDFIINHNSYLPVVSTFPYLGSVVSMSCSDDCDVDTRIRKAAGAFGSLKKCIFTSPSIIETVKGSVYQSLILPILLYGSECWSLTEEMMRKIRNFHNRCVRTMCRVNLRHTHLHHISTAELLERLSIRPIDDYICRRQLRWAGHVSRMSWDRLPRKMLSCWVTSNRPRGCPIMTYGRSLRKNLLKAGIAVNDWYTLAMDRDAWRDKINNL